MGRQESIEEKVKRVVAEALQDRDTMQVLATLVKDHVVTEHRALVTELQKTISENTSVITELKRSIEEKDKKINCLESKLDDLEQYSRRQCLRIFGIEESRQENTDQIAVEIAEKVGVQLSVQDIDRSHRIGVRGERPRPIILKFTSYRKRSEVFKSKKALKGSGVTIREDLTKTRYNVLQAAINKYGFQSVWTMDGAIIIKVGDTKRRITSLSEV